MCAVYVGSVEGNERSVTFGAATWWSRKNLELGVRRPGFNPSCHSGALWLGVNCLTFMSLICPSGKLGTSNSMTLIRST